VEFGGPQVVWEAEVSYELVVRLLVDQRLLTTCLHHVAPIYIPSKIYTELAVHYF
jgi:hypothetical protein